MTSSKTVVVTIHAAFEPHLKPVDPTEYAVSACFDKVLRVLSGTNSCKGKVGIAHLRSEMHLVKSETVLNNFFMRPNHGA
jgi:hypothetical protein